MKHSCCTNICYSYGYLAGFHRNLSHERGYPMGPESWVAEGLKKKILNEYNTGYGPCITWLLDFKFHNEPRYLIEHYSYTIDESKLSDGSILSIFLNRICEYLKENLGLPVIMPNSIKSPSHPHPLYFLSFALIIYCYPFFSFFCSIYLFI